MRWVVELPAESGGTGATVTADGDSWKAALSVARSGKALPKFRCDFDEDGSVRVWDMVTNERFTLRPLTPAPTPAAAPAPRPAPEAAESDREARVIVDLKSTAIDGTPVIAPP